RHFKIENQILRGLRTSLKYKIQNPFAVAPKSKIGKNPKSAIQNRQSKIGNPKSAIQNRDPSLRSG
ncbi:MAG: hypothetical protein ACPGWR_09930, partial [Ardenticatenaceae bacterium]